MLHHPVEHLLSLIGLELPAKALHDNGEGVDFRLDGGVVGPAPGER
jgi:hypothetical protein